jgi:hypothetical protein
LRLFPASSISHTTSSLAAHLFFLSFVHCLLGRSALKIAYAMDPEQPAPYGGHEAPDKEKMDQVRALSPQQVSVANRL